MSTQETTAEVWSLVIQFGEDDFVSVPITDSQRQALLKGEGIRDPGPGIELSVPVFMQRMPVNG